LADIGQYVEDLKGLGHGMDLIFVFFVDTLGIDQGIKRVAEDLLFQVILLQEKKYFFYISCVYANPTPLS
jgi:hypothetical protein